MRPGEERIPDDIYGEMFFLWVIEEAILERPLNSFVAGPYCLVFIYLFLSYIQAVSFYVPDPVKVGLSILFLPAYVYIYALIIYGGNRFKLSRTKWREISFGMDKDKLSTQIFILLFIKGVFLTALTFGLYLPKHQNEVRKFLMSKMHFGTARFEFTATNGEYYRLIFTNLFFCVITLGFYFPWMYLNLIKFKCEHIQFNKTVTFKMTAGGFDYFLFAIVNFILVTFSFGLFTPWVINRTYKYFIEAVEINGQIDFNTIINRDTVGNAIMDVASIDYDIDLGF
jgi:uncharacterized membrane protein YjgN (DUF898 family)